MSKPRNNKKRRRGGKGGQGGKGRSGRGRPDQRSGSGRPESGGGKPNRPSGPPVDTSGVLEMHPRGYGFLRDPGRDYSPTDTDTYVPSELIERYGMRPGSFVTGTARQVRKQEGPRLEEIFDVDGRPPEECASVGHFDELTPIYPESWLNLETGPQPMTTRVIDLLAPLGKGQRGLIVAPPRSGKTVLLEHVGQAIGRNHPDVKLFALLVDERPEEATELRRNTPGQVLTSNLDQDVESHVRLSQLVVERCKRLAERGEDVFLLIDSLTRMSRAFNKWEGDTGRVMSGGLGVRALDIPKRLFASARAFEEGGSLTTLATVLVETGSRMDDLIFEEFKGTGNMELVLDRQLADRRIWPAIDVERSGTRREELLLDEAAMHAVTQLRRTISTMNPTEAMERLIAQLAKRESNREFIANISTRAVA